ncbi:MAG: NAD-dependent epimerase/dehydratase family protein [Hyphomicrobiaceae bacterium]|nr:NAD-dependent epimerase/dehydratase family protein [Hyphomicrobiaceae bacterium]
MKVFITGASGYIGGTVAAKLIDMGHAVTGLVRSAEKADAIRARGLTPVLGDLDAADVLAREAKAADAVVHTAHADHAPSAEALVGALRGSGKLYLHTSGSSIVGTQAGGEFLEPVYDEATPFTPSPGRAPRVALNEKILASTADNVRAVIIAPSLIYGLGRGAGLHSMQVPWLITLAKKYGEARHIGSGGNRWANVHIDDLADLYALALEKAPAGAFYYAENGENSMQEVCAAISRMLGFGGSTVSMTVDEAAKEWGDGPARNTMGSNSRVRAVRPRRELGWQPHRPSLVDEIERGCYREG